MQKQLLERAKHYLSLRPALPKRYTFLYENVNLVSPPKFAWNKKTIAIMDSIYIILRCAFKRFDKNTELDFETRLYGAIDLNPWMIVVLNTVQVKDKYSGYAELATRILERRFILQKDFEILDPIIALMQQVPQYQRILNAIDDYYLSISPASVAPRKSGPNVEKGLFLSTTKTAGISDSIVYFHLKYVDCAQNSRNGLKTPHVLAFLSQGGKLQTRRTPAKTRLERMYTRVRGELHCVAGNESVEFNLNMDGNSDSVWFDGVFICFTVFYEVGDSGRYQSVAQGRVLVKDFVTVENVEMRTSAVNDSFSIDEGVIIKPYTYYTDCRLLLDKNDPIRDINSNNELKIIGHVNQQEVWHATNVFLTNLFTSIPNIAEMSQSMVYHCLPDIVAPLSLVAYTEVPEIPDWYIEMLETRANHAFGSQDSDFLVVREKIAFMLNVAAEMLYVNDVIYGRSVDRFANAFEVNGGDCDDMAILAYQLAMFLKKKKSHPLVRDFTPTMCVMAAKHGAGEARNKILHMVCVLLPTADLDNCYGKMNGPPKSRLRPIIIDGTVKTLNIRQSESRGVAWAESYARVVKELSVHIENFRVCEIDTADCSRNICDKYDSLISVCSEDFRGNHKYLRFNPRHGKFDALGVDYNKIMDWKEGSFELAEIPCAVIDKVDSELREIAKLIPPVPVVVKDEMGCAMDELWRFMRRDDDHKQQQSCVVYSIRSCDVTDRNINKVKEEYIKIVQYCKERDYKVNVHKYDLLMTESTIDVLIGI